MCLCASMVPTSDCVIVEQYTYRFGYLQSMFGVLDFLLFCSENLWEDQPRIFVPLTFHNSCFMIYRIISGQQTGKNQIVFPTSTPTTCFRETKSIGETTVVQCYLRAVKKIWSSSLGGRSLSLIQLPSPYITSRLKHMHPFPKQTLYFINQRMQLENVPSDLCIRFGVLSNTQLSRKRSNW